MNVEEFLWIGLAIPTGLVVGVLGVIGIVVWRRKRQGHW